MSLYVDKFGTFDVRDHLTLSLYVYKLGTSDVCSYSILPFAIVMSGLLLSYTGIIFQNFYVCELKDTSKTRENKRLVKKEESAIFKVVKYER